MKAQQLAKDEQLNEKKSIVYLKTEDKGKSNIQKLKSFGKRLHR